MDAGYVAGATMIMDLCEEEKRKLAVILSAMTLDQLYQLATSVDAVKRVGYGEVTIKIVRGKPRIVSVAIDSILKI